MSWRGWRREAASPPSGLARFEPSTPAPSLHSVSSHIYEAFFRAHPAIDS